MIRSLKIKNFLSFKDEVEISFDATKDKHLEDSHLVEVAKGVRLLKFLVVYGYNASGKTNLIRAFAFLRIFFFAQRKTKDEGIPYLPFLLNNKSLEEPSLFSLCFYIGSKKYIYELELKTKEVIRENLLFYPGTQPAMIFNRKTIDGLSQIHFPENIKISSQEKKELSLKCLPNISVFAAYMQVNTKIKEIETVVDWLKNQYLQVIEPRTNLQDFAEKISSQDKNCKEKILNYLHRADFNIVDVNTKIIENDVNEELLERIKTLGLFKDDINRIEKTRKLTIKNTEFLHNIINEGKNEHFQMPKDLQSEGTLRIYGLSAAIYKAIEKNAFLAIDEIESKLHPQLIEYLIEEFIRESNKAQLLVATHYDNLFDQEDLLRKDNFWFTEKKENGSSNLYSLKQFTGLNRISSLQKAYKFGKFGAIPNMD